VCVIGDALPERLAEVETGGELVPFDNAGLVAAFRDTLVHPHSLITDASHEAIEDGRARRFGSHTCSSPRSGQAGRPQSQDMSGGRVRMGADMAGRMSAGNQIQDGR